MLTLKTIEVARLWGVTPQRLGQMIQDDTISLKEVSPGRYRTADVAELLGVDIRTINEVLGK